jgi:hypothetical protein
MIKEGVILRKLLNKILDDLNITNLRFHSLLTNYLEDPLNGIPQTSHGISSARSNYAKEIKQDSISWKWFVRTLKIIRANKFRVTITILHNNEIQTSHSVDVDLGRTYISGEGYVDD